jgi:hypothetical protein
VIKIIVAFSNTPPVGTPPWSLLNEIFSEEIPVNLARVSGMVPDKLL